MIINFDSIYRIDEGYGNAGEGILLALDSDPATAVYTSDNWDHTCEEGLNERTIELIHRGFTNYAEFAIRFSQPDSWDKTPIGRVLIGWGLWEYDDIPADWKEGFCGLPIKFVSCAHTKRTWTKMGANPEEIYVVKLGIDPEIYNYRQRPPHDIFTFAMAGTLYQRKSPWLVYEVFQELFKHNHDVQLIFKSTERFPVEFEPTHNTRIINQVWPGRKMADLLRGADCFVYPTQGEGFGLCPVEAMAVGTPVICTNWSGPEEYLDDRFAYKLDYTLRKRKLPHWEGNYGYAVPDREHLMELMWHVYTHQDEAREKGELAAQYVQQNLTWQHTATRVFEILRTL